MIRVSHELAALAQLLDMTAGTARMIADHTDRNIAEIHWIAHEIERLADRLRRLNEDATEQKEI